MRETVTGTLGTEKRAKATRDQRGRMLLDIYERTCIEEGLDPMTRLGVFMEHCIAKGANNLLTFQCKDEWKLAYDPDAQLLPELKRRLELADHCIRNHPQETS